MNLENEEVIVDYIASKLISAKSSRESPLVVSIQAGQGIGKSTLANNLRVYLENEGLNVINFSLDNFYKTKAQRKKFNLAHSSNYFYKIPRGLPGTHRVDLLNDVLMDISHGRPFKVPIFDKSISNGYGDIVSYDLIDYSVDIVILEGWCVGIPNISLKKFNSILSKNSILLDSSVSEDDITQVLEHISKYQKVWKKIDYSIKIVPDDVSLHYEFRYEQEKEMGQKSGYCRSYDELKEFMAPYLPFTYVCYGLCKSDLTLYVNSNHEFRVKKDLE